MLGAISKVRTSPISGCSVSKIGTCRVQVEPGPERDDRLRRLPPEPRDRVDDAGARHGVGLAAHGEVDRAACLVGHRALDAREHDAGDDQDGHRDEDEREAPLPVGSALALGAGWRVTPGLPNDVRPPQRPRLTRSGIERSPA